MYVHSASSEEDGNRLEAVRLRPYDFRHESVLPGLRMIEPDPKLDWQGAVVTGLIAAVFFILLMICVLAFSQ